MTVMPERRTKRIERANQLDEARAAALTLADAESAGGNGIRALVINLEGARDRLENITNHLARVGIPFERIPGIRGSDLSSYATRRLAPNWARAIAGENRAGTLGCFLGHIRAWEHVANGDGGYYLVLEDDAEPCGLIPRAFSALQIPDDVDLCFCNTRMEPLYAEDQVYPDRPTLFTSVEARTTRPADQKGIGGEAYFLNRAGAKKLLEVVDELGPFTHVDWFLMIVGVSEGAAEGLRREDRALKVYNRNRERLQPIRHIEFRMMALWPALMGRNKATQSLREAENAAAPAFGD